MVAAALCPQLASEWRQSYAPQVTVEMETQQFQNICSRKPETPGFPYLFQSMFVNLLEGNEDWWHENAGEMEK